MFSTTAPRDSKGSATTMTLDCRWFTATGYSARLRGVRFSANSGRIGYDGLHPLRMWKSLWPRRAEQATLGAHLGRSLVE